MGASFQDLIVWQKAMQVAELVYKLVKKLPKEENYALSDQMRRSAVSIASNIAEGHGRGSKAEYSHFLSIANGSSSELQTQLILAKNIGYLKEEDITPIMELLTEISKILYTLRKKLSPAPNN